MTETVASDKNCLAVVSINFPLTEPFTCAWLIKTAPKMKSRRPNFFIAS